MTVAVLLAKTQTAEPPPPDWTQYLSASSFWAQTEVEKASPLVSTSDALVISGEHVG
jgi:hypothetical protein